MLKDEFIDVRDQLPNNNDNVLFVVLSSFHIPYIQQGIFKINEVQDFWVFQRIDTRDEYTQGQVFKWTLAPKFFIETDQYPEGKCVPLKYCKFNYNSFEDKFFNVLKFGKFNNKCDVPSDSNELNAAKERMIGLIPLCECGKKGIHIVKEHKQTMIPHYYTKEVGKCEQCINKTKLTNKEI